MRKRRVAAGIILVLSLPVASALATPVTSQPGPAEHLSSPSEAQSNSTGISGKVVETMNAGGYTYALIEKKGKKTWVAVPETKLSVGQHIAFHPGQEMKNFKSSSLKRTFDSIIFSGGIASTATGEPKPQPGGKHGGSRAAAVKSGEKISVEKAQGPDSYTVAEIFSQSKKLNRKTAVVKAKVVKVSAGIMGKNWIHLQDGTGDAAKGTSDLIATSQDLPAVGEVVTVKGTIYKDKDFGAGYKYRVIMEDASIQQ